MNLKVLDSSANLKCGSVTELRLLKHRGNQGLLYSSVFDSGRESFLSIRRAVHNLVAAYSHRPKYLASGSSK